MSQGFQAVTAQQESLFIEQDFSGIETVSDDDDGYTPAEPVSPVNCSCSCHNCKCIHNHHRCASKSCRWHEAYPIKCSCPCHTCCCRVTCE